MQDEPVYGIDYDDYHAYITGFTSCGASFGITWEEAKSMDELKNSKENEDEFDFIQDDIIEEGDFDCNGNNNEDGPDDLPF
jgi:hypothetical protein